MNRFLAISSSLFLVACAPASKSIPESPEASEIDTPITIDFQTGFHNASVKLFLNGRPVFDGVLTTDDTIGLAHSFEYSGALESPIEARFVAEGQAPKLFTIDLSDGRYLGFSEDLDSGEIIMEISREPFLYD
jgi:hypothetical protein